MMASEKRSKTENKMTPAERDKLLKSLEESHERLLLMAKNLSREQLHYRPAPDRWTVAECLEHISMVEARVLGAIQKTLEAGPDPSKRSALEGMDDSIIPGAVARVTRFKAPEPLVPTGRCPDDQLLKEFEGTRQQTRAFAVSTTADLRHHFYKHPALGDLDLYQWMLLIAGHCDRHRVQSEEVMASPDFPRARQANAPA
jgi:DinB superfamily